MLTQGRSPIEVQRVKTSTLENESESGLIHSLCSEVVLLLNFQYIPIPHSIVREQQ